MGGPAEGDDEAIAACSAFRRCTMGDMRVVWEGSNILLFGG
jgi:hypothetical protein